MCHSLNTAKTRSEPNLFATHCAQLISEDVDTVHYAVNIKVSGCGCLIGAHHALNFLEVLLTIQTSTALTVLDEDRGHHNRMSSNKYYRGYQSFPSVQN